MLVMSEQAVVAGIGDPGYNANAKGVACRMDEMYLAAHEI
jgi:hypothetical protein